MVFKIAHLRNKNFKGLDKDALLEHLQKIKKWNKNKK